MDVKLIFGYDSSARNLAQAHFSHNSLRRLESLACQNPSVRPISQKFSDSSQAAKNICGNTWKALLLCT